MNPPPDHLSREEFENFLQLFTHEIRNRLNALALEAADLAEQAGPHLDGDRLQKQIQECSSFLRTVRDAVAAGEDKAALPDLIRKWKETRLTGEK